VGKFQLHYRTKNYRALNNWAFDKFHIKEFWEFSQGKNVKIAILDSGIPDHVDLIINKRLSKNFTSENDKDNFGHATSVVGLLNSQLNFNDVLGICPDAEIICVKVLDFEGGGEESDIKRALEYCLEIKPDIINLSFGTQEKLGSDFEHILQHLKNNGIFVICASGNKNQGFLDYPASSEHTIAVGSIDNTDAKSNFSSYGIGIDFAFPGSNLYTTCGTTKYCYVSGTSFATPICSGILALYLGYLKKINASYTFESVVADLEKCSIDLGEKGLDQFYGYGSIDLKCLFEQKYQENKKLPWYKKVWNYMKASKR
jgi:minor extracellular protease Epr